MNDKHKSRKKIEAELEYYDKNKYKSSRGWLERWLINLQPMLPSAIDKIIRTLGDIKDRKICEIGCGTGSLTLAMAKKGAVISAVDISETEIRIAEKKNSEFIPEQVTFHKMNVCELDFPDSSFDFVTGMSILHHTDINAIGSEIYRVLKPGGRAIFTEPLAHNPISNLWRKVTPSIRTKNEKPLRYDEIRLIGEKFRKIIYREFALLTLLSSLVYLFTFSRNLKLKSGNWLERKEQSFMSRLPFFKKMSGLVLIEFTK